MRSKQPHRRCSNQSSQHLRKTPTKRQLRRNRRLHPQQTRRSRPSLGSILTESSRNRRRLLAFRSASRRWSTRQQIQTHALRQKRRSQELGSSRCSYRRNSQRRSSTRTPIQCCRNQRRMHRPNCKTLLQTQRHMERTRRKTQPLHRLTQTLHGRNAKRHSLVR